ncbi:MAG: peptide chain release factor N(5)-glutamine methyltransferase [Nitrospira sp.]
MTVDSAAVPGTIGWLILEGRLRLEQAGIPNAAQEVAWLLERTVACQSHELLTRQDRVVSPEVQDAARAVIERRAGREPLQYILGTQEFCGLEFAVTPAVLIPRPETELLVQEVVRQGGLGTSGILVDVGTGSGCLAITLAKILNGTKVLAIDRSDDALRVAEQNANTHGVAGLIEWLHGDLLAPLAGRGLEGRVGVIVSNPPYIPEEDYAQLQPEVRDYEPRTALVGGPLGTEYHRRLLIDAQRFLAPQGLLLMELGQGQAAAVAALSDAVGGYAPVRLIEDAAGIERVIIAQRRG